MHPVTHDPSYGSPRCKEFSTPQLEMKLQCCLSTQNNTSLVQDQLLELYNRAPPRRLRLLIELLHEGVLFQLLAHCRFDGPCAMPMNDEQHAIRWAVIYRPLQRMRGFSLPHSPQICRIFRKLHFQHLSLGCLLLPCTMHSCESDCPEASLQTSTLGNFNLKSCVHSFAVEALTLRRREESLTGS